MKNKEVWKKYSLEVENKQLRYKIQRQQKVLKSYVQIMDEQRKELQEIKCKIHSFDVTYCDTPLFSHTRDFRIKFDYIKSRLLLYLGI